MKWVNPFQPSVAFHTEISHLICNAKQMTGFYTECNTSMKWVKGFRIFDILRYSLKRDSLLTLSIENKSQVCFQFKIKNKIVCVCVCVCVIFQQCYMIVLYPCGKSIDV